MKTVVDHDSGVYRQCLWFFPPGKAMMENLTSRSGHCNHRKNFPMLVQIVSAKSVKPERVITQEQPIVSALDVYRRFADRKASRLKVELRP